MASFGASSSFEHYVGEQCALCNKPVNNELEAVQPIKTVKGLLGLQNACRERGDDYTFHIGQKLHRKCRDNYRNKKTILRDLKRKQLADPPSCSPAKTRSKLGSTFDFQTDCLLCGQRTTTMASQKKHDSDQVFRIRTFECEKSFMNKCIERGDKWGQTVRGRIESVSDLHAADALYHQQCSVNFRTNKNIPTKYMSKTLEGEISPQSAVRGRPVHEEQAEAFIQVTRYIAENDDEQTTLSDLCAKMDQFLQEAGHTKEAFTEKYMRQKLINHFGDSIIITTVKGKSNVVTFKSSAGRILRQFYEEKGGGIEEEKQRIIKAAAKLILSDIKAIDTSNNNYPSCDDIANESFNLDYLPSSLRLFMDTLLYRKKFNLKKASIGQALIQAARPKVLLSPLQVGLGVEVHHLFGSRYLVDHLNKLGFSVSYTEVKRFEQNAALANSSDIKGITPSSCVQFIADNVDHNIRTLDGNGTFHGMGIIASVTPAYRESTAVARQENVMSEAVSKAGKIPIKFYTSTNTELRLVYKPLRKSTLIGPAIDLIWKMSWPLRSPRPGWSGMMQSACDGSYPGQSKFTFLPMIDLDPTNMSCIYSTLQFVSDLAVKHNILPIVTFDQPLWWKAKLITSAEPENSQLKSIVLKLGGFYTQMSFLGSIGHIMEGSGLQELLEMVFAKNAVTHMLSGHSVARAVRGHFLVDGVLNAVLGSLVFNYSLEDVIEGENADKTIDKDLAIVLSLYDQVINKALSPQDVERCSEIQKLSTKLEKLKEELSVSRTANLWLQYMDMVDILRHFIRAERAGDWLSHLQVLNEMLPYVAAAGHNLYTKSIYIYLQDMQNLEEKQPEVFRQFTQGHHVLRRSDRYWAGLSADLAIEQLLMRSIKAAGGLTRGRGMSDSLRTQWILAMPACADVNRSMQEVSGMEFIPSNQHKDMTKARQDRDCKDMFSLLQTVLQNNPFVTSDPSLRNIFTGVVADASVNVDLAKKVGDGIVMGMTMLKWIPNSYSSV